MPFWWIPGRPSPGQGHNKKRSQKQKKIVGHFLRLQIARWLSECVAVPWKEEEEERGGRKEEGKERKAGSGAQPRGNFSKNAILPPFRASLGPLGFVFGLLSPRSSFWRNSHPRRTPGRKDLAVGPAENDPRHFWEAAMFFYSLVTGSGR